MTETLKAAVGFVLGLEPHQVGLVFMVIGGVLVASMPVEWIKRK